MPDFLKTIKSSQLKTASSSYTIGIFFHIMRRSDGTGGQTQQEVNTALSTLTSDYLPNNINISLLGTDEIKNDTYYNYNNETNFEDANYRTDADGDGKFDVFNVNTHPNAIDIYLFADDKLFFGLAANIPGTALVIGGNAFSVNFPSSHVLSHEFGHCLGLYHTFHGTYPLERPAGSCPELVNGSNGTTCGDYVQDTPADPAHIYDCGTQSTCTWNCSSSYTDANGAHYNPNTHLFMAYTFPTCMNQHTPGQVTRMFNALANSCLLQNTLVMPLTGSNLVCSSGTTFTVNNLASGWTVSWNKSSNLTLVSSNSNPAVFAAIGNGYGWVQDTLKTSSCSITKVQQYSVWAGIPQIGSGSTYTNKGSTYPLVEIPNLPVSFDSTLITNESLSPNTTWLNNACYLWWVNTTMQLGGQSSVTWTKVTSYPSYINWSQNGNDLKFYFYGLNQTATFNISTHNICGNAVNVYNFASIDYGSGCTLNYTLSLNPASTTLTIVPNIPAPCGSVIINPQIQQVTVYDTQGNPKKTFSFGKGTSQVQIDISSLKIGTYILDINDGTNSVRKTFIIQR